MSETEIDIFKQTTPQTGEFFKFAEKGDGVQGTYIDRREAKDGFGNDQIIYVLKDKDGKIWNAAFRKSSVVVHEQMKSVKPGQIVGFKFDDWGTVKRGVNAGTKFRIVNVYADPKHVDKEWVSTHGDAQFADIPVTEETPTTARTDASDAEPVRPAMPQVEEDIEPSSMDAIRNLARSKGLTNANMTEEESDAAIRTYVDMEITEENLPKVIIKLTSYKF